MDQKTKDWLKAESQAWVSDKIITAEQCRIIQDRYPVTKTGSPLLMFFAIIGSLLVGSGIILVFATNWWSLPLELRIVLAFLPLLLAQGICLYTVLKKYASASFREGSAVFLSLSFFAALGLIGQIFHTPSDLSSYLLVCILFTLPGVYLFSSKAAMTIYVLGSVFIAWDLPWWYPIVLTLLTLPYFYREIKLSSARRGMNYLLLLLSVLISATVVTSITWNSLLEPVLICGLALLLIDALFHKIGSVYFFTSAKLLAILSITVTLLVTSMFIHFSETISAAGLVLIVAIAVAYFFLRRSASPAPATTDLLFASATILVLTGAVAGVAACLLTVGIGAFYIVYGSKTLILSKLNYGMALIVCSILIRFFDSTLGLLSRGIVFILLGLAFLGINLYVSQKRRRLQQ